MSDRPTRPCDLCGQEDDHPRHVDNNAGTVRHLDCCASAGCPTCLVTEVETEGRRGQDLIDHLNETRG